MDILAKYGNYAAIPVIIAIILLVRYRKSIFSFIVSGTLGVISIFLLNSLGILSKMSLTLTVFDTIVSFCLGIPGVAAILFVNLF